MINDRDYPLAEEQFKEIEPLIAAQYKRHGRYAIINNYQFFCAILHVLRTGVSWRDLPQCYGIWLLAYDIYLIQAFA